MRSFGPFILSQAPCWSRQVLRDDKSDFPALQMESLGILSLVFGDEKMCQRYAARDSCGAGCYADHSLAKMLSLRFAGHLLTVYDSAG
jgi:hypothetical protein